MSRKTESKRTPFGRRSTQETSYVEGKADTVAEVEIEKSKLSKKTTGFFGGF